ncbi:MAG TPA: glycosyltransferase family 2 protein [Pirellulales bacterium]|jgi:dolichol-phosphate mannosyltransferase|nr:glycosyltransferase family 2 protein [Pirellulales bacterium]
MCRRKLSVVIPAYNEDGTIAATVEDLRSALVEEGIPFEIIVVNDNSTDSTAAVVEAIAVCEPRVRMLHRRPPGGFGRAIRTGLDAVSGDFVVIYMADYSDHPADVIAYYRKLEEGYDCVFGSRFIKGSHVENYPWMKLVVNRIVNKMIQWLFWCRFNDLTNAFKAYRAEVIRAAGPFRASHFNITIEMSLSALIRKYHIVQIPISWSGRTAGVSKLKMVEMGRRYLSTLAKVMAERFLIGDDVLAERLALHAQEADETASLEDRVRALEDWQDASLRRERTQASEDCNADLKTNLLLTKPR